MAEQSNIEWTDATFNPWVGCTKISPACDNCYAEGWSKRAGRDVWGPRAERQRTKPATWNGPRKMNADADAFGAEHERPRFVFCASLADVFDNRAPEGARDDLWQLIRDTPRLVWLLLTKRPQNIEKMLPDDWGDGYPNVWLGTTVEDQKRADMNVPALLSVPAVRRFLSCEPLVGPIDLTTIDFEFGTTRINALAGTYGFTADAHCSRIHWVITGGESGSGARPADPNWYRSLRDQCARASVPFHFKQWGEFDADQNRVGKKKAGRLLDGVQHDGRPAPPPPNAL